MKKYIWQFLVSYILKHWQGQYLKKFKKNSFSDYQFTQGLIKGLHYWTNIQSRKLKESKTFGWI